MPHFVIDHTHLAAHSIESIGDQVESFVELLDRVKEDAQLITKSELVYYAEVLPGLDLTTLLFSSAASPLDGVQRSAMIAHLGRIPDVAVDNVLLYAEDLVRGGLGVALLSFRAEGDEQPPAFGLMRVCDIIFLIRFYRSLFTIEDISEDRFHDVARLAFPGLYLDSANTRFNRFSHPYRETRSKVVTHLEAINDYFRNAMADCVGDRDCIQRYFAGVHSIDLSPESSATHGSPRAMRERHVTIGSVIHVCEWHSKLYPTTDRIHFDAGSNLNVGGRIVIGIFASHLPT